MTTPVIPADDKVRRQHGFLTGDGGGPTLIGGEGKLLSRSEAITHLRALRNTGRLAADHVTLVDYDGTGDDVRPRNLGKVSTLYPASGSREISRFIARAAGYGGPGDDDDPPAAA
jgi:hypothetical protein